jgi:hypothetical protein
MIRLLNSLILEVTNARNSRTLYQNIPYLLGAAASRFQGSGLEAGGFGEMGRHCRHNTGRYGPGIHLDTVCVFSYDERTQGEITVLKSVDMDGNGWLLVDDLVDTGQTARIVRNMLPKAHFATVYAKPEGRPLVDTFITEVSQDTWILFPWDTESQFVQPIVDIKQGD